MNIKITGDKALIDSINDLKAQVEAGEKAIALIKLYEGYIEFLGNANQGAVTMAYVHGWRCPQEDIDKGLEYRKRISALKEREIK